jgi:hypothetical protein
MRRAFVTSAVLASSVMTSVVFACTSIEVRPTGAAVQASKGAFCGALASVDRAGANVTSTSGLLAVLKSHSRDLAIMKRNVPSDGLGQLTDQVLSVAETAISSNNANELNNVPSTASIDTYCRVDGTGKPLPSYFGKGTSSTFCSTYVPVHQVIENATQNGLNNSGVLAIITAHQAQLSQLASELSTLPKSIKAKATAAVHNAQTAVTTKNPSVLPSGNSKEARAYIAVALYCGQNM